MSAAELPVVVIGAGPVGLAAAAHLRERGLPFLVLEEGEGPGAAVREWGHVRLFSPWRFLVDAAARRALEGTGWSAPDPEALPTGAELVSQYLEPLGRAVGIRRARVTGVSRAGLDKTRTHGREEAPFLVQVVGAAPILARAVIDASGTWRTPNPLAASGLPGDEAPGMVMGPLPDVLGGDKADVEGRRVLVVGSGHSAAGTLLALAEVPGARIHWAIRRTRPDASYGGGEADELPGRGRLGSRLRSLVESGRVTLHTSFALTSIREGAVLGSTPEGPEEIAVDAVVPATGFRPDLSFLRELRLDLDPAVEASRALAPLIDPEFHSCGTVAPHGAAELAHPERDFFIVGMKSYGRAPTFLAATGYEQVRSIAAALAGDHAAAARVELELPETGVCSAPADEGAAGCCADPEPVTLGIPTGLAHGRPL